MDRDFSLSLAFAALIAAGGWYVAFSTPVRAAADDAKIVAALDTQYQLAVKRNDAATMARILHEDFVLVVGDGRSFSREDLLKSARERQITYEQQDEEPGTQVVRVWGDTAVVTAKLLIKASASGKPIEKKLWFSDTYVRTASGWRYAFGQASLALPTEP